MDVNNRSFDIASGASEPRGPAVVSGAGLAAGPNVAGSPRSLSCDREDTGVATQAPVILIASGKDIADGKTR